MRHYSLEQWVDFARNVVGPQEKAEMESHLGDGCKQCSKTLSLWQRVHNVGRQEHAIQPPENAVRSIKGAFAIYGPRKVRKAVRAIANVLFDSAATPLPEGVRSAATAERQLLYGVGEYRIDVRIEPQLDSDKVALVGQILNSTDPGKSVGAVPVRLLGGRAVLVESMTSEFGEFCLECDLGKGFSLRVQLPMEELSLPLVEPIVKSAKDSSESTDSKRVSNLPERRKKRTRKKV